MFMNFYIASFDDSRFVGLCRKLNFSKIEALVVYLSVDKRRINKFDECNSSMKLIIQIHGNATHAERRISKGF